MFWGAGVSVGVGGEAVFVGLLVIDGTEVGCTGVGEGVSLGVGVGNGVAVGSGVGAAKLQAARITVHTKEMAIVQTTFDNELHLIMTGLICTYRFKSNGHLALPATLKLNKSEELIIGFGELNIVNHCALTVDKLKADDMLIGLNQHGSIVLVVAHLAAFNNIAELISACTAQAIYEVQNAVP